MLKFNLPYLERISDNKKTLYKNAASSIESGYDKLGNLLTIGDKISDFGENINDETAEIIDCGGHVVAPGLIDIQVHFVIGSNSERKVAQNQQLLAELLIVVCQPNTNQLWFNPLIIYALKAKEKAYCNVKNMAALPKAWRVKSWLIWHR